MKTAKTVMTLTLAGLITHPFAQAQDRPADTAQWSAWKPMAQGYIARRHEPLHAPSLALARQGQTAAPILTDTQMISARRSSRQQPALWLYTSDTGLYAAPIADLAASLGIPPNDLRQAAKNRKLALKNAAGKRMDWSFDKGSDRLFFAAEAYNSFFTHKNAYRLSLSSKKQKKPGKGNPPSGNAPLSFTAHLTFEQEPDMLFSLWTVKNKPDADYWFWDYLYGGYKDKIEVPLFVPDPDGTSGNKAQIRITLQGWTDLVAGDEHQVHAELNGTMIGQPIIWDGFNEAVLSADFDPSLLNANGNNTLILHNQYAPGTHPGQWLNRISLNYPRLPIARNNRLYLQATATGAQTVSGFTQANIQVYALKGHKSARLPHIRIDPDGAGQYRVTFKARKNRAYLIATYDTAIQPDIALDIPSTLKKPKNRADYLIIAPQQFSKTAKALQDYRKTQYPHIRIVWLEDIYDEFNGGRVDPYAISRFMQYAQQHWKQAPSAVVLIGKGTLDHKDRMGYGDSFLPTVFASTPWSLAASDGRLLGDDDGVTLSVGRLPIISDAEGIAYVDKLKRYESAAPAATRQAVLVADNPDEGGNFHANSDMLADYMINSLGFSPITKLYHPDQSVRPQLIASSTWQNADYISYDGHGSASQIGDSRENFIKADDAALLANSSYPLFTALTCAVGDFSLPGTRSLASALVLNPQGGAMAAMVPTGLSLDADAQALGDAFITDLYNNGETIGNALLHAKQQNRGNIESFLPRIYSIIGVPDPYTP